LELAGVYVGWPPLFIDPEGIRIIVQGVLILILLGLVLSRASLLGLGETIQVHKYISLAYIFLLAGGFSLLLTRHIYFNHFLIVAIPIGLLGGLWMARVPARWSESVHFLLLVAALIYQYFPLL
jgi:hypothetical protein